MNGYDSGSVSLRLIGNYIAGSPHLGGIDQFPVRDGLPRAARRPANIVLLTPRILGLVPRNLSSSYLLYDIQLGVDTQPAGIQSGHMDHREVQSSSRE